MNKLEMRVNTHSMPLFLYMVSVVIMVLMRTIIPYNTAKIIMTIVVFISLLGVIRTSVLKDTIPLFLLVVVVFLSYYTQHYEYGDIYSEQFFYRVIGVTGGIWGYLVLRQYNDIDEVYSVLKASSIVMLIFYLSRLFVYLASGSSRDNMDIGYGVLPSVLILFTFFILERKFIWGALTVVGLLELFFSGVRGTYLCVAVYLTTQVLIKIIKVNKGAKRIGQILLTLVVFIIFAMNYESVLNMLGQMIVKNLGGTRAASLITSGDFFDNNGRSVIWAWALQKIDSGPFFGYGPLSDQYMLNGNVFSHNVALEMMITFGKPIAFVIMGVIIFVIIKMLVICKDKKWLYLFVVFGSASIPRLFFSSSFWYDFNLFIMLALCVNYFELKRMEKMERFMEVM